MNGKVFYVWKCNILWHVGVFAMPAPRCCDTEPGSEHLIFTDERKLNIEVDVSNKCICRIEWLSNGLGLLVIIIFKLHNKRII